MLDGIAGWVEVKDDIDAGKANFVVLISVILIAKEVAAFALALRPILSSNRSCPS